MAEPVATAQTDGGIGTVARSIAAGDAVPESDREIVLFRGRDPREWNAGSSDEEIASICRPIVEAPEDMGFLRIRRLDTDESVVAEVTRDELLAGGSAKAKMGWSGRGEEYFGACHLGLFDESLPREVETKFGAGGWGFGHRESIGSGQAYAWAGLAIEDPGEGFEISVGPLPAGVIIVAPPVAEVEKSEVVTEEVTAETVAAALAATVQEQEGSSEPEAFTPGQGSWTETDDSPESSSPGKRISDPALDALAKQADKRTGGLILFRSNDPTLWNTDVFSGANRRSRSLDRLPEGLSYLRLRRIDTGAGVVIPITNAALTDDGDGMPRGFNGANEKFYGAHHLGIFDESLPQDLETRFTYGGWGFGHSALGAEEQAWGWAGELISADTVFEITVFRRMPILTERDRMLEGG